jgi:N-methylhydantoinase B
MAGSHDVLAATVFSGRSRRGDRAYVYLETIGGGNGGQGDRDGMDAAHVHITNSLNMPIEAVEIEYPLRVEEYALIPDSGGAGRHRGGLGIAREVRILEDGTTFSARADGFRMVTGGLEGGRPASRCRVVRNRGTEREAVLDPKQRLLVLAAGETIRMETPGGAGLGDPGERDPLALARDLADGRVTAPADRRGYGEALPSAASPAGAALGDAPGGEDE